MRHIGRVLLGCCFAAAITTLYQLFTIKYENTKIANKNNQKKSETADVSDIKQCAPQRNIVFLKSHKCGSTSVQNILLRRAYKHHLKVALPESGVIFDLSTPFRRSMLLQKDRKFNIICHHMVFNEDEIDAIMEPNPLFISIVRNPVTQFESFYNYFNLKKIYGTNLTEFVFSDKVRDRTKWNKLGANMIAYLFGISEDKLQDENVIDEKIIEIEMRFDLVMIAERFDESIVLLRHLLCWDIDEMVSFRLNGRKTVEKISNSVARQILKVNEADAMIYNHFHKIFDVKVTVFGKDRMRREMKALRDRTKFWIAYCLEGAYDDNKYLPEGNKMPRSDGVIGYKLRENLGDIDCELLAKSELYLLQEWKTREMIKMKIDLRKGKKNP